MITNPTLPFQLDHRTFAGWQEECLNSSGSYLAIVWDGFERDYYPIYVQNQEKLVECLLAWHSEDEVTEKIIKVFDSIDWSEVNLSELISEA